MPGSVPAMRFSLLVSLVIAATAFPAWAGTPKEAAAIREAYDRDFQIWVLKLQVAPNAEERTRLSASRPDTASASRQMWNTIQPNLAEDWTLDHAAWLLRISAGRTVPNEKGEPVPLIGNASTAIRQAVEKHHLASKNLAPLCMAVVAINDPNSLPLLQKIEASPC
jgi:hypothetical protein